VLQNITSKQPLVTVVCVCYNQADYVEYALTSVLNQTYTSIELIVVDDASTDHSWPLICDFAERHPGVRVLQNAQNSGNCMAFNRGLALAKGKYLIDLAADDLLLPERVARQVALFESLTESYGVIFGNVELIDKWGISLGYFYPADAGHTGHHSIPSGDIYEAIVRRSFISAPSMMMRKQVLTALGGYDESLSYEDFDFWVRSARRYQYYFQSAVARQIVPQTPAELKNCMSENRPGESASGRERSSGGAY
jgi:glycosyltransferase involved in cell wall biosynthesis